MTTTTRAPGYYWLEGDYGPKQIGKWTGEHWELHRHPNRFQDEGLGYKIGPRVFFDASQIWAVHAQTLEGFYASEVYVVAATKEEAVRRAGEVYDAWIEEELIAPWGYHPLVDDPFDDDLPEQAAEVRARFMAEVEAKIFPQGIGLIFRRS